LEYQAPTYKALNAITLIHTWFQMYFDNSYIRKTVSRYENSL